MEKVILFDYDGVIADSLTSTHKIYNNLCGKYGCKTVDDKHEFVHLFDKSPARIFKQLGIPFWRIPFAFMDYRKALQNTEHSMKLIPGMKSVLTTLAKKYHVVIVTSNLADVVEEVLKQHKIKGIKTVIGSETSLSKVKKIRKVKRVFGRNEYYYIGDTRYDMVAGRKARTKTIAVTWGWQGHSWLKKANPDYLFDNPKQLLKLFP